MRHVLKLDDPGVAPLLLSLRKRFPAAQVSFPVVDYGCVPVETLRLATVPTEVAVVRIVPGGTAAVEAFYSTLLVPVELELLGLRAVRSVFAAVVRGRLAGACVVNGASEFLAEERKTLGPWWFAQEYECRFMDTVDQVFATEVIDEAITEEVAPLFGGTA